MHSRFLAARPWVVVALLFIFMAINFADKAVIGLVGPEMMRDLHLSAQQFGLVGSSFFLLFTVSGISVGLLANRVRMKWLLAALSLAWALVQFPLAMAVSFPTLIACRVVLGAGEGPAYPLALHAGYGWFENRRRNIPHALIQVGGNFGVIVAGPLLTYIAMRDDWHAPFLLLGVLGLVWTSVWMLLGEDGPLDRHPKPVARVAGGGYADLFRNPTLIGVFAMTTAAYAVIALSFTWYPSYLRSSLGYSAAEAGWLFSLLIAVQVPVTIGVSWVSQALLQRGVSSRIARGGIAWVSMLAAAAMFVLLPGRQSGWPALALLGGASILSQFIFIFGPLIIGEIVPLALRAGWLSINNSVATLSGLVAPALMGHFIQHAATPSAGFDAGFEALAVALFVAGAIGLLLVNPASAGAHAADALQAGVKR
ncbi:hexuronate transporter [mine drainage metagenome]|uniref:Hexuronate transporter n=1 Tax=mine drainage metagenome TaxID=410659 RepID=A0A1J5RER7_9ZZZZ